MMLLTQVALLLIDEVHLLNENRGAALEAGVVSRIKMISRLPTVQGVRMHAIFGGPLWRSTSAACPMHVSGYPECL